MVRGFWRYKAYADIRRGSLLMRDQSECGCRKCEFTPSYILVALHIEICTASSGFLALARLLYMERVRRHHH